MKFYLVILSLFFSIFSFSQKKNKLVENKEKRFSWGAIPALSFDTDLGIKYGGIINFFDHGSNKNKHKYTQDLYLKATNTTKNTTQLQALLESEEIINNALVMLEASFFMDKKLDFFGFNGTNTYFNKNFIDVNSPEFKNPYFYSFNRKFLRIRSDVQKFLNNKQYRMLFGATYQYYYIDNDDSYKNSNTSENLFSNYLDWKIIPQKEINGGSILNFKAGLIFDSRNDKCFCTNGSWVEAFFVYSPPLFGGNSFGKSIITYRYYKGWLNDRYSFSGRLSLQNKLFGEIPFYNLSTFYDSKLNQEGIGGAYTLRGVMRNIILSNGFSLANIEIKAKLFNFSFLKQDFMTAISIFSDFSYILQKYKFNKYNISEESKIAFFNDKKQKINYTYGPGFYIVFNRHNIITINYGISPNKQLGSSGLYVGSSMLF